MSIQWGGSGIEKELFDQIRTLIPDGAIVIEFGSGKVSTKALAEHYNLYSVDENNTFIGLVSRVKYIHAPINDGWYDRKILKRCLPKQCDLILIDGPAGTGNRYGILHNLDLIQAKTIIVHDTNRRPEWILAETIAYRLNKQLEFKENWAIIQGEDKLDLGSSYKDFL